MGATLYILCFPNGKLYVGITVNAIEWRFYLHCRSRYPIGRAIRKYGRENVHIVVLHHGLPWAEACEAERFYIKEFRTRIEQGGYNLTDGGDGVTGLVHSVESRKKMSEAHRGVLLSEEHCHKVSDAFRGRCKSIEHQHKLRTRCHQMSAMWCGKRHSDQTRCRMSESQKIRHIRQRALKSIGDAWQRHSNTWSGMARRKAAVCCK